MTLKPSLAVFIDPNSADFLEDRLFDATDSRLNRDGTLLPFVRLKQALAARGIAVHTADRLRRGECLGQVNHYWSIGLLDAYREFIGRPDVVLRGFMLFEPPLVAPAMYEALPELTHAFSEVFVHNTVGDGYSLQGVDGQRLRKFRWPQPYGDVIEPHWSRRERHNRLVVVAGNHNPQRRRPEFYSRRIEAVAALAPADCIDLFGRGWERWWSRHSLWLPYWIHRRRLMQVYRGACDSKLEVLSRYRFSLCLENMPMEGYVTEKIFDCFYAGTVPVYGGGRHIERYVPADTFIAANAFPSWRDLWRAIENMSEAEWDRYRLNAQAFVRGPVGQAHFDSLTYVIGAAALGYEKVAQL